MNLRTIYVFALLFTATFPALARESLLADALHSVKVRPHQAPKVAEIRALHVRYFPRQHGRTYARR